MKPVVLAILDGFGVAPAGPGNAIGLARKPALDRFAHECVALTLQASGEAVGLPWGEMGNSEVGHLALGGGKIFYQDLPRINRAITDGSFFTNQALVGAIRSVREHGKRLHLIGLVSTGGVHSYLEHLFALLELARQEKVRQVFIHGITDGRDAQKRSADQFVRQIEEQIGSVGLGTIATLSGRYWAMDRDHRWERTEAAYRAIIEGEGKANAPTAPEAVSQSYASSIFDEELVPTVIGAPSRVEDGDAIIFFNFRADRMRQIVRAVSDSTFDKFVRPRPLTHCSVVTLTEYERGMPVSVAFPPERSSQPFAWAIANAGLEQLHVAETEKYAHVTFFFNGGREEAFPGEKRVLIPSPQDVATYDLQPAMSAREITAVITAALAERRYAFIVANFANADMVGHTGNLAATIKAVEVLDQCVGEIAEAATRENGTLIITADHGNAEVMIDSQTGEVNKEHTVNPVPCFIVSADHCQSKPAHRVADLASQTPSGLLCDVPVTILKLMDLPVPSEMTGRSLV